MEKEFWQLKNLSPNSQLDVQLLRPLLSPPLPKQALQGLFNAFDENRDGHIDFKELCCGVSAACRGPEVERTRCKYICDNCKTKNYITMLFINLFTSLL